jgi:carbamoyl-phosphate synthase large subunit
LPTEGEVKHAFLSVRESDKKYIANIAKQLMLMASNLLQLMVLMSLKEAGLSVKLSIKSLKVVHIL